MHFLVTKSIDTDSTRTFTILALKYGILASSKCTKCICPTFGQKQHVQITSVYSAQKKFDELCNVYSRL